MPTSGEAEVSEAWIRTSTVEDHLESAVHARADVRGRVRVPASEFGLFAVASSGELWGCSSIDADAVGVVRIVLARATDIHVRVVDANDAPVSGVLVEGRIVAEDLAGPMAGSAIDDLVEQIRDGNAYVNIHTSDGMDPPDSGPGDYRLGEIRGQIE